MLAEMWPHTLHALTGVRCGWIAAEPQTKVSPLVEINFTLPVMVRASQARVLRTHGVFDDGPAGGVTLFTSLYFHVCHNNLFHSDP